MKIRSVDPAPTDVVYGRPPVIAAPKRGRQEMPGTSEIARRALFATSVFDRETTYQREGEE